MICFYRCLVVLQWLCLCVRVTMVFFALTTHRLFDFVWSCLILFGFGLCEYCPFFVIIKRHRACVDWLWHAKKLKLKMNAENQINAKLTKTTFCSDIVGNIDVIIRSFIFSENPVLQTRSKFFSLTHVVTCIKRYWNIWKCPSDHDSSLKHIAPIRVSSWS